MKRGDGDQEKMKRPIDYTPKYSLSIIYLRMILGEKELKKLIKKYVAMKVRHWKHGIYKGHAI
jgi:hypothetical protein